MAERVTRGFGSGQNATGNWHAGGGVSCYEDGSVVIWAEGEMGDCSNSITLTADEWAQFMAERDALIGGA